MTPIPPWLYEKALARFPLDPAWDCEQLQSVALTLHDRAQNLLSAIDAYHDSNAVQPTAKWPEYIRTAVMELGCLRADGKETVFKLMGMRSEADIICLGCKDAIASGRGIGGLPGALQGLVAEGMKIAASPQFASLKEMLGPAFSSGVRMGFPQGMMYGPVQPQGVYGTPEYGELPTRDQLAEMLESNPHFPPEVKASIQARIDEMDVDADKDPPVS